MPTPEFQEGSLCFYAVDIETTGNLLYRDCCFAIGWAYGTTIDDIKTGSICLDMKKEKDVTWKKFWEAKGYETRCYDEFWSKHEDILDRLQDKSRTKPPIGTKKEMVEEFQAFLTDMEKRYAESVLITDTTAFDTVWLSHLLQEEGNAGIGYRRNGAFSKSLELQSYRMAAYGVWPLPKSAIAEKPWNTDEKYKTLVWDHANHDHDPENDAHQILRAFFVSIMEVQRRNDNEAKWKTRSV